MTIPLTKRRRLIGTGVVLLLLFLVVLLSRVFLTGLAVGALLKSAGAAEIKFHVAQASPWRLEVEDVGFLVSLQSFAAKRVTLDRAHWWTPSLGTLRVEQARVPVRIADLAGGRSTGGSTTLPSRIPLEEFSIDGHLVIQAAGLPDQALTVNIEARPAAQGTWDAKAQVNGPGLILNAEGRYHLGSGELAFTLPVMSLDLKAWQGFLQHVVPLPAEEWELDGKFSGKAEGRLAGEKLTAGGSVQLREGRAHHAAKSITAEGIEADLEFIDFGGFATKPGTLRLRELRMGQLTLRELAAKFALEGSDRITVLEVSLLALGGKVSAEPFTLAPSRSELDAVLLVEGISIKEVMALTQELPAKATGRVNGRFPVHLDSAGLRLGTGWLELMTGVRAEIEFNAKGLLTGGSAPNSPSYAVLQKIESGLLKLKINELRLDIRPTGAPDGRTAQLHIKGEPVDPEVKAPVTLDLNVNGPLEKLLNMGMDSRLSIGSGK